MMSKRYLQFSTYLKQRFGKKIWKIPVDAGMTCPNRDGTKGNSGCIFCDNAAFAQPDNRPILTQIQHHMARLRQSRNVDAFIIYFQSFTNTYAPLVQLRKLWDQVSAFDNVVGFAVGTRPDCVDDAVLDLLASYTPGLEVWLELGVQSTHNKSLALLRRGHDYSHSHHAIIGAAERGLKVSTHLILGLPGESDLDIHQTIETMAALPIHGLKLHPLQILSGTVLADMYQRGEVELMPRMDYLNLVCDVIERIPSHVVMQRLTAEAYWGRLIAPEWGIEKMAALNEIDAILEKRDSYQGCKFTI